MWVPSWGVSDTAEEVTQPWGQRGDAALGPRKGHSPGDMEEIQPWDHGGDTAPAWGHLPRASAGHEPLQKINLKPPV